MTPARTNQNWLPGIFNEILGDNWLAERRSTTAPAVNIIDGENEYKVEVAAPGMTKEDFKVHINEDNELVISLEKKTENKEEDAKRKGTYLRREFSYTQFQQSLLLPDNIERENISAKVENGVMTIDIPKKKIEETARSRLNRGLRRLTISRASVRALRFCFAVGVRLCSVHPALQWVSGFAACGRTVGSPAGAMFFCRNV